MIMKKEEKIAKKRKEREKKSKVKILLRREAVRKERKEESKKYMLEKLVQPKQNPIINMKKKDESMEDRDAKIKEQLLKNQQILKALEEEFSKERQIRDDLNGDLESKGHGNLQDKLAAMHKEVVESEEKLQNPDSPINI
jgi:hypothetical protein